MEDSLLPGDKGVKDSLLQYLRIRVWRTACYLGIRVWRTACYTEIRVWRTACYMRHEDKGVEDRLLHET